MVWEFPAVSQSRIEFWNKPQFTQSGMWWFTLIFGMFGLHHLYLRSPQTALIFFIANFCSLGYLWAYDLTQLSSAGGYTTEILNKHGLAHPWGAMGLAQGMWKEPEKGFLNSIVSSASSASSASPPSIPQIPTPPTNNPKTPINTPPTNNPHPLNYSANFASASSASSASASSATPSDMAVTPTSPTNTPPTNNPTNNPNTPTNTPTKTPTPPPTNTPPNTPPPTTNTPNTPNNENNPINPTTNENNPTNTNPVQGKNFKGTNRNGNATMVGGARGDDEPPNPAWFFLYALLIPCAPLAQILAGDTNNAVSRFLDLTIIPLGFMFYFGAMMYDYWVLFSNPADLFVAGSKRFFPFTYLGMDADGHSERITGNSEIKPCPPDNFIITMMRVGLPLLSVVSPGLAGSIEAAIATKDTIVATVDTTKKVVIDGALAKAQKASSIATQIGSLSMPPTGLIPSTDGITKFKNPTSGQGLGTMVGGARETTSTSFNTLDYTALGSLGAVILGGLVLSANRTLNVFKQGNDTPPNPRTVRNDVY